MATVTIAHALFTWRENGDHRIAYHGDQVDIPDEVVDRYRHLGAFSAPSVVVEMTTTDSTENRSIERAPATVVLSTTVALDPDRPKNAATRPVWEAYAVGRGIDAHAVQDMSKDSIIAAINELDTSQDLEATHEQEHDNV